jgi:hypothetical protein
MTRKALISILLDTANSYDENNRTAEANALTKIAIKLAQDFEEEDFSNRPEYGPQSGFSRIHYGKYKNPPQFGWKGDKLEADDPDALDRLIEGYYSKWHPDLYESRVFHRFFDPATRKHHAFMSKGRGRD